ncbi:aldose epimerase family protein [Phycicoccus avicenniae]|uniref:aldose epimerase family protein n=1 Tax=Phycicoccus avicenniae TaxID=2828860 RepID=UPI003D29F665
MTPPPRSFVLRSGGLALEVLTSGASVRRLVVDDGRPGEDPVDVVLGHADPATYVGGGGYLGATVGRFTNRLAGGTATVDGVAVQVPANDGPNALHGGPEGFDAREWEVLDDGPAHLLLGLTSPDGDQGLPGEVVARARYTLRENEVEVSYEATTTRTTLLGLTNHSYFHLDGEGSGDVLDHTLEVAASAYTPVGDGLVPTGEVAPVAGTPLDLRAGPHIGDVLARESEQLGLAGGIDHHFVVDGDGMRRAAVLTGRSGRRLEVHTDRPGVQVYTGAHFDGSVVGLGGRPYDRAAGVALETQGFPDAPHHPAFPSAVVRPGEVFSSRTLWRLGRA